MSVLWNTNNTDKNSVNKQNTHTQTRREKKHWKELVNKKTSDTFMFTERKKSDPLGLQLCISLFKLKK